MTNYVVRRDKAVQYDGQQNGGYYYVAYENLCTACRDERDRWIAKAARSALQSDSKHPPSACEACTDASKARAFQQAATGPAGQPLPAVREDRALRARYRIVPESAPDSTPIVVTEDDDIAFRPEGVVVNGRLRRFSP